MLISNAQSINFAHHNLSVVTIVMVSMVRSAYHALSKDVLLVHIHEQMLALCVKMHSAHNHVSP